MLGECVNNIINPPPRSGKAKILDGAWYSAERRPLEKGKKADYLIIDEPYTVGELKVNPGV